MKPYNLSQLFLSPGAGFVGYSGSATYTAGTVGAALQALGPAAGYTQGSVPFAGAGGALTQDNANLFYSSANHHLGIGTTVPNDTLDVNGNITVHNNGYVYCGYDSSNNWNGQNNASIQFSASQIVLYTGNVLRGYLRSDGIFQMIRPILVQPQSGSGGLTFVPGDSTHTGYMRFYDTGDNSQGYIGYNTIGSGAHINYTNENVATVGGHNFSNQQLYAGGYNPSSDLRLKTNIAPATLDTGALLDAIEMVQFDWKDTGRHASLGFIAQDLYTLFPEAVIPADENLDTWHYDLAKMLMLALAEIKSLRARVATLEARP